MVCPNCGSDDVVPMWKWALVPGAWLAILGLFFIWVPILGLCMFLGGLGGTVWGIKLAIFNRKLYKCGKCKTKRFVLEKEIKSST